MVWTDLVAVAAAAGFFAGGFCCGRDTLARSNRRLRRTRDVLAALASRLKPLPAGCRLTPDPAAAKVLILMDTVNLYALDDGRSPKLVASPTIPAFTPPPDVLGWGQQVFKLTKYPDYLECFGYSIPVEPTEAAA